MSCLRDCSCPCSRLASKEGRAAWELRCRALTSSKGTALHHAAEAGDVEAVQELLKAADLAERDGFANTALHVAAVSRAPGAVAVARLLLERGAQVSDRNLLGLTPLHARCCRPGVEGVPMLELLLGAGACPSAPALPDFRELEVLVGETPLQLASQHAVPGTGAAEFVARLCSPSADGDVLQRSPGQLTSALEYACAAGDADVVAVLVEAAPRSELYGREAGLNATYLLRLAVAYECVDVVELLLDPPPRIRNALLQMGADPSSVLHDEGSSLSASEEASFQAPCADGDADVFQPLTLSLALHDAICLGNLTLVRLLLRGGASASGHLASPRLFEMHQAHLQDLCFEGRFPVLHALCRAQDYHDNPVNLALHHKQDHIAEYLLKRANPVPFPDGMNRTSLHLATLCGKTHIVELLLETGHYHQELDCGLRVIDFPDRDGWTALGIALHYRDALSVRLLLAHGADADRKIHCKEGRMRPIHKAILLDGQEGVAVLFALLEAGAEVDELALELAESYRPGDLEVLRQCSSCDRGSWGRGA